MTPFLSYLTEAHRRTYGELERAIGYRFRNPELLTLALTHKSMGPVNNEKLEFVGDRVLGFAVANELHARFPDENEGQLAKRFNILVAKTMCAAVAREIGLPHLLRMSENEARGGGATKETILADAIEAVLGAIYQDSNSNFKTASKVVVGLWSKHISAAPSREQRDHKTELQELLQGRGGHRARPVYTLIRQTGPANAPKFLVQCKVGHLERTGEGRTRKAAEQDAAAKMMDLIRRGRR